MDTMFVFNALIKYINKCYTQYGFIYNTNENENKFNKFNEKHITINTGIYQTPVFGRILEKYITINFLICKRMSDNHCTIYTISRISRQYKNLGIIKTSHIIDFKSKSKNVINTIYTYIQNIVDDTFTSFIYKIYEIIHRNLYGYAVFNLISIGFGKFRYCDCCHQFKDKQFFKNVHKYDYSICRECYFVSQRNYEVQYLYKEPLYLINPIKKRSSVRILKQCKRCDYKMPRIFFSDKEWAKGRGIKSNNCLCYTCEKRSWSKRRKARGKKKKH